MTWTIQTRDRGQRFGFGLHLGHPTRWPETDQPGIYVAPHSGLILAMHFPVGAADVWAEGAPGWRLVCAPRRPLVDEVMGALLSYTEDEDVGRLTCLACRRWSHARSRTHRHRVFPPRHLAEDLVRLGVPGAARLRERVEILREIADRVAR